MSSNVTPKQALTAYLLIPITIQQYSLAQYLINIRFGHHTFWLPSNDSYSLKSNCIKKVKTIISKTFLELFKKTTPVAENHENTQALLLSCSIGQSYYSFVIQTTVFTFSKSSRGQIALNFKQILCSSHPPEKPPISP